MDRKTLLAVTRALDKTIADEGNATLNRLKSAASDRNFVQNTHRTLRTFGALRTGAMPEYNEWDAFLYSVWYQPGHVNLAYSCIEALPNALNPLKGGSGQLFLNDFGSGQLAAQWALVVAASEALGQPSLLILQTPAEV